MGWIIFQSIMSNLQVSDSTLDLPCNCPLHEKLFKIRPFLDMMDKNFKQSYKCGRDLSFDEECCPFKGRLKLKCYNRSKPNKWHIKIFKVSDARTRFVAGLDIYTGKIQLNVKKCKNFGPRLYTNYKDCGWSHAKCSILGKGHHVYLDNYYCSPEHFFQNYTI